MIRERVHPHFDRMERTDPITGHTIENPDDHPWLQEGDPDEGLTIYFDTEESRQRYMEIQVQRPERDLGRSLSNDSDEGIDEG